MNNETNIFQAERFEAGNASRTVARAVNIEDLLSDEDLPKVVDKEEEAKGSNDLEDFLNGDLALNFTKTDESEVEKEVPEVEKESTKKEVEKPKVQLGKIEMDYKEMFNDLIKQGVIDDFDVIEMEDGSEVALKDIDIDRDMFFELVKGKIQEKEESLLENRISVDSVSEFTKELIEIEKAGGDVRKAIQAYNTYKEPLYSIDLDNEQDQLAIVSLLLEKKGLDEDDIKSTIKGYKVQGILKDKAEQAKGAIEDAYKRHQESLKEQAIEAKKAQEEYLKEYKKNLGDSLKSFQLNDNYRRKLVDIATSKDENGMFKIDAMYNEVIKDPVKSAELILFLTDKEEYLKQQTEKARREEKIDTMRKFKFVKKDKGAGVSVGEKERKDKTTYDISEVLL